MSDVCQVFINLMWKICSREMVAENEINSSHNNVHFYDICIFLRSLPVMKMYGTKLRCKAILFKNGFNARHLCGSNFSIKSIFKCLANVKKQ